MNPASVMPGDTVTVCLTFSSPPGTPMADIYWVLDVTGSMSSSITNIKNNITAFTSQLSAAGIDYKDGLVEYRDSPDEVDFGLAADDAQFLTWVNAASPSGGGDWAEGGMEAITVAASSLAWRPGATRTLIVITDAPVHAVGYDYGTLNMTATAAALYAAGTSINVISSDLTSTYSFTPGLINADPALIPPIAGGSWLNITSAAPAWTTFITGLGTTVASYSNVVISDPLPPQLIPIPGSLDGGTASGNTVTWTFSTVGRGDSITRCMLSIAGPGYSGAITNTANAKADGVSPTTGGAVPIYYVTPTPTITPSPTITPTHSITPTFSITQTFTHTPTVTPTGTFTITTTKTATPTITPTFTPTIPPLTLVLHPPNPNPSNNGVWLPYSLGTNADVDIQVWTIAGEPVRKLTPGYQLLGVHEEFWDHQNEAGTKVGSGVYVYRVRARSLADEERREFGKCAVAR